MRWSRRRVCIVRRGSSLTLDRERAVVSRELIIYGRVEVLRMLRTVLPCALLLCSLPAIADTGFLDRTVTIAGETYRYQVYLPVEWTPQQKWPVILYLHGAGARGSDGMSQANGAHAVAIRADRTRFPAVFVLPQARPNTMFGTPAMQAMVLAQLDAALKEFNGDVDRVYLIGFSMGGAGVLRLAAQWPGRFAAAVDVAGFVRPDMPFLPQQLVDEDRRIHSFLVSPNPYTAVAQRIRSLPMWDFHSNADETVPVSESRQLIAALKNTGAVARYSEYSGANHGQTHVNVWAEQDLMSWLLAQRRRGRD